MSLLIVALGAAIAGANVVTSLSDSQLLVTGDASPDAIVITQAFDTLAIAGVDGTLVDGSSASVTFSDVQRLTVKLKQGNDRLTISQLTLPGRLDVGVGKGDDAVELDQVVTGAVSIQTNKGYDAVWILGPSYVDSLSVQMGSGNDLLVVEGLDVGGDLDVVGGADDDDVAIAGVNMYDDLDVHLGNGDDFMSLGDAAVGDYTRIDGDDGDDGLVLYDYLWFGDELEIAGFGHDHWWWW